MSLCELKKPRLPFVSFSPALFKLWLVHQCIEKLSYASALHVEISDCNWSCLESHMVKASILSVTWDMIINLVKGHNKSKVLLLWSKRKQTKLSKDKSNIHTPISFTTLLKIQEKEKHQNISHAYSLVFSLSCSLTAFLPFWSNLWTMAVLKPSAEACHYVDPAAVWPWQLGHN